MVITLGEDLTKLMRAFDTIAYCGEFTEGRFVRALEGSVSMLVSELVDQQAVACNSCGSGLFMLGLAFGRGTAIVSTNTFFATGAMMREAGWDVVLADCSPDDFCLSPETILEAAKRAVRPIKAVVLTHVGGAIASNYRAISDLCKERGWLLIEDAAHAFGASRNGLVAGALGDAAVFSLYPTKAVPAGEGGIVVTRDASLAEELRLLRNYGKSKVDGKIEYSRGFNFRLDEWTSAVALHQVRRMDEIFAARLDAVERLRGICPPLLDWQGQPNWYKYIVPSSFETKRVSGSVYMKTDQLAHIWEHPTKFPGADAVAAGHKCLPLDETVYANKTQVEIEAWLAGRA